MPTTITGSASGYNPTTAVATTGPADLESIDAADVNVPFQDLADALEWLRVYGPYVHHSVTTWSQVAVFDDTLGGGTEQRRIYMGADGLILFTTNAFWTEALAPMGWAQDDSARVSSALLIGRGAAGLYDVKVWTKGTGYGVGSEWAAWSDGVAFASVFWATSAITAAGDITSSSGNLVSTAGSVSAVSAAIGVGGMTVAATGITVTSGGVLVSAGSITASGDPAVNEGRVSARHLVSSTAAAPTTDAPVAHGVTNTNLGLDAGVDDGTVTVTNATDMAGLLVVTTGAATSNGKIVEITLNKALPTTIRSVQLTPADGATTDLGWNPFVDYNTITAQKFQIHSGSGAKKLATATTYRWWYSVGG